MDLYRNSTKSVSSVTLCTVDIKCICTSRNVLLNMAVICWRRTHRRRGPVDRPTTCDGSCFTNKPVVSIIQAKTCLKYHSEGGGRLTSVSSDYIRLDKLIWRPSTAYSIIYWRTTWVWTRFSFTAKYANSDELDNYITWNRILLSRWT